MSKWYDNEDWLTYMYVKRKLTPEEIAEIAGINIVTVYRLLKKYKIKERK